MRSATHFVCESRGEQRIWRPRVTRSLRDRHPCHQGHAIEVLANIHSAVRYKTEEKTKMILHRRCIETKLYSSLDGTIKSGSHCLLMAWIVEQNSLFWRGRRDSGLRNEGLTRLGGLILPPLPRPEIIVFRVPALQIARLFPDDWMIALLIQ